MNRPSTDCHQTALINTECKKILKAILKSQKELRSTVDEGFENVKMNRERLYDRVKTQSDLLVENTEIFTRLEHRIIIMEEALANILKKKDYPKKNIPDHGEEYTET